MGFTAGTGAYTETEEIQDVPLTSITANLWTHSGADSSWNTANNWYGVPSGAVPLTGSDVLLNNAYVSAAQTIAVGSNQTIRSLQIDAPFGYTLSGGSLEFNSEGNGGASGIVVTQTNGTAVQTVNSNLQADNSIVIENNTSSALNLGGTLATGGFPVNFNGSGSVTDTGVVSGTGSVFQTGTGSTTLSGANTYSGGTTIVQGTLDANNATALGTGSVVLAGGTLGSTSSSTISNTIALEGNASLSGITTSGALTETGGSYTLDMANATQSGNVALSDTNTAQTLTVQVDTGNSSAINGTISNGGTGAGGLTKTGNGTLTLGAADTYTGATTVTGGTLGISVNNAIAAASNLTLNNSTLQLNGKSDVVGNLSFNNGTIDFGAGASNTAFVFNNSTSGVGVLTIADWTSGSTALAATTSGLAAGILGDIYFSGIGSGAVELGTTSTNDGVTSYLITPNNNFLTWNGSSGFNSNWSTGNNWVGGTAPVTTGGSTQKVDFTGTTRLTPAMNNNYSVNALKFDNAAGAFNIGEGTNTLTLSGTAPSLIDQSANAETISGGTVALPSSTVVDVSGTSLTISSALSGAGALNKLSAGTLALSANNSGYSGAIAVQAGTLAVSGSNNVLGTAATTVSSGATLDVTGALTLTNGLNLTGSGVGGTAGALKSDATSTLSGAIALGGDTTVNSTAGTLTLSGVISGAGDGLILSGAGTTTLTGTNTYTGNTTVTAGTVNLSAATGPSVNGNLVVSGGTVNDTVSGQLGANTSLVLNSGTFSLGSRTESVVGLLGVPGGTLALGTGTLTDSDTGTENFGGTLTGSGTLDKENTGELVLAGTGSTFTGTIKVDNGVVLADGTNVTGTAASTVSVGNASNGSGNSGNFEIEGGTTQASKFTLGASSTSTTNGSIENVSGNNTLSGAVTVSTNSRIQSDTGTLTMSGNDAIGANTLNVGGNGSLALNGIISGTNGQLTKDGTGTVSLGGVNTYTGATTVSAGTLQLNVANAITSSAITANGGTVQLGATNAIGSADNLTLTNGTLQLAGNSDVIHNLTYTNGTIDFGTGSPTNAFVFNNVTSGTGVLTIDDWTSGNTTLAAINSSVAAGVLSQIYFAGIGSGAVELATSSTNDGTTSYVITPNTSFLTWNGNGANSNWSTGADWIGGTAPVTTGGSTQKVDFTGTNKLSPVLTSNYSVNALKFDSAAGAFNIGLGTNSLTLSGTVPAIIQQSNSNETISGTGAVAVSANAVIDVGSSGGTGNLTISAPLSGAGNISKLDAGTLLLSGNNSAYTGAINVAAGTVSVSGSNSVLGTGATTVSSGGTLAVTSALTLANALNLTGTGVGGTAGALQSSATSTLSGAIALGGATTVDSTAGTLTLSGGISGTNDNLTFAGAGNTVVSSAIATASGSVTMSGSGSTTFSAGNTYTGQTTVNSGTLNLSDTTGSSVNGNLTVNGGTVDDNDSGQLAATTNLALNGGTFALAGAGVAETVQSLSGASGATLALGTGALTVAQSSTTSYAGAITGTSGSLTKNSTGSLTISGSNTYAGATTVNGGTLALGSAISSTSVNVNGGTLQTNVNSALSGSSTLTIGSGGTVNLNSTTQSIATLADSGTLSFGSGGALTLGTGASSLAGTVSGTGTLSLVSGTNLTLGGSGFTDPSGLSIALGGGTVTLGSGATSLSGAMTGSGTLVIGAGSTLTLSSNYSDPSLNIVLAGGTLKLNGTTDTFGSLSVTTGSILDFASSASVLSVSGVSITGSNILSVNNWTDGSDYFYSTASPGAQGTAPIDEIVFNGYAGSQTRWNTYTDGPGSGHQITPAPEPATYGAIFVGLTLLGIVVYRRRQAGA